MHPLQWLGVQLTLPEAAAPSKITGGERGDACTNLTSPQGGDRAGG